MTTSTAITPAFRAWVTANYPPGTTITAGDASSNIGGGGVTLHWPNGTTTVMRGDVLPMYGIGGDQTHGTSQAGFTTPAYLIDDYGRGSDNPNYVRPVIPGITAPAGTSPGGGAAPPGGAAGSTSGYTGTALTTAQKSAFDLVKGQLDQYGLGSLSQFVYNEIVAGRSSDEVARDLRTTPEFAKRFPGIIAREKAGLPAISPGEYVSYENTATQLMRAAGLPKGFYDSTDDFTSLVSGDVSPAELNDRIQQAKDATYNIPPEVANRLHSEFGLAPGSGELASYFLDPNKALPLLQRQFDAARIGGAADQVGYAGLSNASAEDLVQNGVSADQARQGFNELQRQQELFNPLPGEQGSQITQLEQLSAAFKGNVAAQQRIERERGKRQAEFAGSTSYATTGQGVSGLGRADSK